MLIRSKERRGRHGHDTKLSPFIRFCRQLAGLIICIPVKEKKNYHLLISSNHPFSKVKKKKKKHLLCSMLLVIIRYEDINTCHLIKFIKFYFIIKIL